jgi:hypothetical protein
MHQHVNNCQATQYIPTIEAFEDHHWEGILEAVQEVLSKGSKCKQSRSMSSRAISDFEMEEPEGDESSILISDEE